MSPDTRTRLLVAVIGLIVAIAYLLAFGAAHKIGGM